MQKRPSPLTRVLPLFLRDLFPLCDVSSSEDDKHNIVNAAYQRLFEEIIPGFNNGEVLFVLAEVLELDREASRPRILVYSNKQRQDVDNLLSEYFDVIGNLREDEWSISKADALYTSSQIWCAETTSPECQVNAAQRNWEIFVRDEFPRSYEFEDAMEEAQEVEEIRLAFSDYLESLYELHLKNYPYAYVMLIPIFLGSMYGDRKSRKKLGAVFLHFATTTRIKNKKDLLRIYGRTLLFWHYYFTSEAVGRRQTMLEESDRKRQSLETDVELFKRIRGYVEDIRTHLGAIRKPMLSLDAELNPARILILGGEDLRKFFQSGPPIYVRGKAVTPKHDWAEGAVDSFKTLVAGIFITAFQLEDIDPEHGFWPEMSRVLLAKANESSLIHRELINCMPALVKATPSDHEVKEIFKIVKSWFNDSFKIERSPGLPITMLEFAFRAFGSKFEKEIENVNSCWVASKPPAHTLEALGSLHEKQGIASASLRVVKARSNGKPRTNTTLTIDLAKSYSEINTKQAANLTHLRDALQTSISERSEPRGDMTKFLWLLSGGRALTLNGTVFESTTEGSEFEIDFINAEGNDPRMRMRWRGEIHL